MNHTPIVHHCTAGKLLYCVRCRLMLHASTKDEPCKKVPA